MVKTTVAIIVLIAGLIGLWFWLSRPPYQGAERLDPVAKAEQLVKRASMPKARDYRGLAPCGPEVNVIRTDCAPAHLAHLPPHPGEAGKLTLEGIDSDKNGIRDDVQIYIAENYGYSEKAVAALQQLAMTAQQQIVAVKSREAAKSVGEQLSKAVTCYQRTVDQETRDADAMYDVVGELLDTDMRLKRYLEAERLAANQLYPLPQGSDAEVCGYDPTRLKN
jgi:hypothetical protein